MAFQQQIDAILADTPPASSTKRKWAGATRRHDRDPTPHTAAARRLAYAAYDESCAEAFSAASLYATARATGATVLVSPKADVCDEAAALLAMNARAVGRKPAAFVTSRRVTALKAFKAALRRVGLGWTAFQGAGADDAGLSTGRTVMIITRAGAKRAMEAWVERGAADVFVVVDLLAPKALVRRVAGHRPLHPDGDVRSIATFCTNHTPEVRWHAEVGLTHASLFTCHRYKILPSTVAHKGAPRDVVLSLVRAWNSEMAAAGDGRRTALAAWAADAPARVRGGDCPICLGRSSSRAVMQCCSACFCLACAARWLDQSGTCAGCRGEADQNTVHLVEDAPGP